jgi:hypothetical protein
MNYEKLANEINDKLNFKLTEVNMNNLIGVIQKEHEDNIRMKVHGEELNENKFEEIARPMIKYLCENYHPHVTVIITPTSAELLEGLKTVGRIEDYIRD